MNQDVTTKTAAGRFFERFRAGEALRRATPRALAAENRPCADFPSREREGCEPSVALDVDYRAIPSR
jgi:hypothetical protein